MLTPASRPLDMLLLTPEMPLSFFPPPLLSKLLFILKALALMPLLETWIFDALSHLGPPSVCGFLSQPGQPLRPFSPCLLARLTYPLEWESFES